MLKKGDIFNRKYEVINILGKGGMGKVFLVQDQQLGTFWALKEVDKAQRKNETAEECKERAAGVLYEAKLLSKLNSPYIPRVTEIINSDNFIYILQDYVEGITLKELLDSQRNRAVKAYQENLFSKMNSSQRSHDHIKTFEDIDVSFETKTKFRQMDKVPLLNVAKTVADVFIYLHNLNPKVIYRDLKPENIMIDRYSNIKLIDFGIAFVEEEGKEGPGYRVPMGTWGYAAPEQIGAKANPTSQTDIYNYGRTMYELASGICPGAKYDGKRIKNLKPLAEVRPDLDEGIVVIINKCMEKDLAERYVSFKSVKYAWRHYKELGKTYSEKFHKRMYTVGALGVLSLALLGGSGINAYANHLKQTQQYEAMITQADMYNKVSDLIPVINKNPSAVKPVMRLVQLYEKDNKFTVKEEQQFLDIIASNIAKLKTNDQYGDLAYQIGVLYAYYYDASSNQTRNAQLRMSQSTQWFEDAVKYNGPDKEMSNLFAKMGAFNRDITMAQKQYTDSGMYKKYYNTLVKLQPVVNQSSVSGYGKVQYAKNVALTLSYYRDNFLSDGVTKSQLRTLTEETKINLNRQNLGNNKEVQSQKASTNGYLNKTLKELK